MPISQLEEGADMAASMRPRREAGECQIFTDGLELVGELQ